MREIENVLVALVLGTVAYRDWRTKQISCLSLFVMSILIVLLRIILVEDTIWSTLGGAAVGAGFFLFSKCSKESIGYGDCWIVLLLGVFLGGKTLMEVVFVAMLLTSLFSLGFCMVRGWKKQYTIPFAPFLAVAYMGVVFL